MISGTHNELRVAAHPLSGVQGVFSALSTNTRKVGKLCSQSIPLEDRLSQASHKAVFGIVSGWPMIRP